MGKGFREDATSYMLFLRLAPVFPFTLINVVPAILGVRLSTFAWTTFVGIIPGVTAYAFAGEGLRSIVSERAAACAIDQPPCGTALSPADLVTKEILIAFALLGVVSLLPVVLKRLRRSDKRFGWHTACIEAVAAHFVLFNQHHRGIKGSGCGRNGEPGRAASDNAQIGCEYFNHYRPL